MNETLFFTTYYGGEKEDPMGGSQLQSIVTLTPDRQKAVAAISIDPNDFYDNTNRRYQSGQLLFNNINAIVNVSGGNRLRLIFQPARQDNRYNDKEEVVKTLTAMSIGHTAANAHYTAVNYGFLDASAEKQKDGTYIAYVLIVEALDPVDQEVIVTLNYDKTFTAINVYSDISASDVVMTVNGNKGAITKDSVSGSGTFTLQLRSLATSNPNNLAGSYSIVTPANAIIDKRGLSRAGSSAFTYKNNYSRVFAFNNNKVSPEAVRDSFNGSDKWVLANVNFSKPDEDSSLALTYRLT